MYSGEGGMDMVGMDVGTIEWWRSGRQFDKEENENSVRRAGGECIRDDA